MLRLLVGATTNDVKGQLAALRDLGALPPDTDLDAVIGDLATRPPAVDPTTLSGDELVREIQRLVKALLGFGASMPKELMLFVKNMVFLDGAIARSRPTSTCSPRSRASPPTSPPTTATAWPRTWGSIRWPSRSTSRE